MTTTTQLLKIGSRTSDLAVWQTNHVIARLQAAWPGLTCRVEPFITQGDKTLDKPLPQIGGKGLFTAELESALRDGRIDLAVHSLKDLPVEDAPGLTLGAILNRAPVADGLVARNGWTLATLPPGTLAALHRLLEACPRHVLVHLAHYVYWLMRSERARRRGSPEWSPSMPMPPVPGWQQEPPAFKPMKSWPRRWP